MEGLRGYAALLVYLLHLTGHYYKQRHGVGLDDWSFADLDWSHPLDIVAYWLFSSHYGVDIFFVLSGYLIAGIVTRDNFRYGPYVVSRLLRIYPVLITSTFVYVFYRILMNGGNIWWGGIAGNLLLLNGIPELHVPAINVVTWSLFFEVSFYVSFPLLWLVSGRNLLRFVVMALAGVVLLAFVGDNYARFAMFIAGVALKTMPQRMAHWLRHAVSERIVFVLYLIAAATFMYTKQFIQFLPLFLIPSFLFIDRAVHGEGWLNRIFSNKWLRYFGNISFSFYIYHPLGLGIAHLALDGYERLTDIGYLVLFTAVSFGTSLVLATLSYVGVERLYFTSRRHVTVARTQQAGDIP